MKGAATEREGGGGGGGVGADMAGFVGGKGLSLFLSGFSLTIPLLSLSFLCPFPLSPSPSLCVYSTQVFLFESIRLLSTQASFSPRSLFISSTHLSLSYFLIRLFSLYHISIPLSPPFPASLPSNLLTPNNLSCLISFIPRHFLLYTILPSSSLLLSIMCISPLPPSQLLPLRLISDAVY